MPVPDELARGVAHSAQDRPADDRATDGNAPDGHAPDSALAPVAEEFAARTPQIVERYRALLTAQGNPLGVDPASWQSCRQQAELILADCAQSLRSGHVEVDDSAVLATRAVAAHRVGRGVHPVYSTRAASALFEAALVALFEVAQEGPRSIDVIRLGTVALQRGLDARLEAGAMAYDAYLFGRVREANAAARTRLARDVHDRVGNGVSVAARQLDVHLHSPGCTCDCAAPHRPERPVVLAQQALAGALADARDLITELRRSEGSGQALEIALTGFAESLRLDEPAVRIRVRGSESRAATEIVDELFLVLREALRNAFTHARAKHVSVDVNISGHEVRAEVLDDGTGFDPDAAAGGRSRNGLASMRERAASVGGTLALVTGPGRGTRVSVSIPLLPGPGYEPGPARG